MYKYSDIFKNIYPEKYKSYFNSHILDKVINNNRKRGS